MKTFNIHEAKTNLSSLIDDVQHGEEIIIARYGKPVAKLVPLNIPAKRTLGFLPITFDTDLSEPTSEDILRDFEGADE